MFELIIRAFEDKDIAKAESLIIKTECKDFEDNSTDSINVLHLAVRLGNAEIVQLLLTKITNQHVIDSTNQYGTTVLHAAAEVDYDGTIMALLLSKMTTDAINAIDHYGNTALYLAAACRNEQAVELILITTELANKIINTPDCNGFNPLHMLALWGNVSKELGELALSKMDLSAVNNMVLSHLLLMNRDCDINR